VPAADWLAIAASAVFLVRLLPQPIRLARSGVAAGTSAAASLNAVVSALAWIAYGLVEGLPVVWAVSVAALVPCTWQAVLLRHRTTGRDLLAVAGFVAALAVAGVLGVLGVALAGTVLVTTGPQVHRALRDPDLSGIARATWWVAILDAVTWGAYGWAISDPALVGYFIALLAAAVIILVRLARTRPVARALTPPLASPAT
jgi:uncharacterized protein with PQ loop repeat